MAKLHPEPRPALTRRHRRHQLAQCGRSPARWGLRTGGIRPQWGWAPTLGLLGAAAGPPSRLAPSGRGGERLGGAGNGWGRGSLGNGAGRSQGGEFVGGDAQFAENGVGVGTEARRGQADRGRGS